MLFAFAGVLSLLCSGLSEDLVRNHQYHDTGLNDVQFTDNVVFTVTRDIRSQLDCGQWCITDQGCASFTYMAAGGQRWCRGYSVTVLSINSAVQAIGARTFRLGWMSQGCTSNSSCLASNSACFQGSCLCFPGFYYSLGTARCLETCAEKDVGRMITNYGQSRLNNDITTDCTSSLSWQDCLWNCFRTYGCHYFNYHSETGTCCLTNIFGSPVSSPVWESFVLGWSYHQRSCV